VYDSIIYRYTRKCVTDFVNVGIKLLNTEAKETGNRHTADLMNTLDFPSVQMPIQVMMQFPTLS